LKIKILESATQDLVRGFTFYEEQSEGLGQYFLDSLFADIDSLSFYAGIHSVHFKKYHRLLSKRFPLCGLLQSQEQHSICVCCFGLPS